MSDWFHSTTADGSLLLALPLAVVAGLVSFFSPCVIPLLPGYLSYATGLSGADLAEGRGGRGRMLAGAVLFVLGFSVVFVLLGVAAGTVGDWLIEYDRQLKVALGIVSIVLGLAFMGLVPWLQRDVRFHRVPAVGLVAAPLLGVLFAVGWTPCIGPTLGVMLNLAGNEGTASRGGLLLAFYCIGLGLPFIVFALLWRRALGTLAFIRRHIRWVTRLGGAMFVLIGLALLTGWWDWAVQWLQIHLVDGWTVSV
ncbi:cytochrome c biogenesis CcdA family protein [Nocardioides sp. CER19]|uniref:cytochrome c biogenesis CcdA family protein n=1 Tax=Nocardioides sp. CER19 TaxID=3038538 RepID=UPI0024469B46|nr:cytochrome c biogenesis CcdA family protein [Nocardioides sp. CER19]MDH2414264.1 cytochrome c biogenesis CcdA family protein [Nocardioides sp. CER19]